MNEIQILKKFKTQLVNFLDELNNLIQDDADLLTLRIFVQDQLNIYDLMASFIVYVYPHKERAKERDEKFFLEKRDLFSSINPETVEKFKGYWRSKNYFDEDDRKMIWKWADLFFKLGDEYIKRKNL